MACFCSARLAWFCSAFGTSDPKGRCATAREHNELPLVKRPRLSFLASQSEKTTTRTITGLFDTQDQADHTVRSLKDAGIASDDISIVASNADGSHDTDNGDDVAEGAGTGAGVGAAVGGTGGLLAGLGVLAIPGVGPVVAGGWLLATAIGAAAGAVVGGATGGLIGALTAAGVDERDAHVYAEGVRRGGVLVTARVDETYTDAAAAILRDSSMVDIESRRHDYEAEGWESFDEGAEPYRADQVRASRTGLDPRTLRN